MFVNKATTIDKSTKQFDVPKADTDQAIALKNAFIRPLNTKITVEAKVISKQQPGFIESKQLKFQELQVADHSGSIRLTIWADIVDTLPEDKSYRFQNVTIRQFKGNDSYQLQHLAQ